MKSPMIFDSTLRDGSHAINQQMSLDNIEQYCKFADNIGFYTIIVGHGNGLGASSLQVGLSKFSDVEMLRSAKKNLKNTKLGAFMIPGFGTIRDNLEPALNEGVDLVCIASHCTEADITRQHIQYVVKNNIEAYGVLMLQHMTTNERILEEILKMESYGAKGVILMDSAGASTIEFVRNRIRFLTNRTKIPLGFHPHNNLSLAVANSLEAVEAGARIIDGTVRGFGAGAGNCQLEVLIALLQKQEMCMDIDLYSTMDLSENIVSKFSNRTQGISALNLISGIAGVFSSYATHVEKASKRFGVDSRDIFLELGKRKVVGGQEDIIVDVAMNLAQCNKKESISEYHMESLL